MSSLSHPPTVAVILSGGGGTRLWPVSTEARPKQFLRLFGDRSLFQETLLRLGPAGIAHAVIVANEAHGVLIAEEVAALDLATEADVLLEPMRRDSAAAIAAGVSRAKALFGAEAVIVVLPCDHLIPDHAHFARDIALAALEARKGRLVTFGIKPRWAASDFGYIRQGEPLADGVFRVAAFVEKPDPATAARYLDEGGYYWNSGMFVFSAGTFAREAEQHMPEVWAAAQAAVGSGTRHEGALMLSSEAFAAAPKISIDYALFEKSDNVAVIPVDFAWSDVGAWNAVHDALPRDKDGNASIGAALLEDSRNTLAIGYGVPVIGLGLDNLVVIASPQGVFVAPRERAAEIKALLGKL
jgi:mannose-1-phosphate guanylyltransferase/mannose-6-phosphate isomerase